MKLELVISGIALVVVIVLALTFGAAPGAQVIKAMPKVPVDVVVDSLSPMAYCSEHTGIYKRHSVDKAGNGYLEFGVFEIKEGFLVFGDPIVIAPFPGDKGETPGYAVRTKDGVVVMSLEEIGARYADPCLLLGKTDERTEGPRDTWDANG